MRRSRRELTGRLLAFWAVLIAAAILRPLPALANARSQALYAKGLIPFHAEQWEEAYRLFDEAVRTDPEDALAVYYRGLAAARRGSTDEAVQEIQRALTLWPDLPGAALDIGILSFNGEKYDQAETWLRRAYEQPWSRFAAALFLGVTRVRRGDNAGAHQFLSEAATDPELRPAAEYYDALALFRDGQAPVARERLALLQSEHPDTEVGRAAAEYLQTGVVTGGPAPEEAEARRWSAYGNLAFEYDSNVGLAPGDVGIRRSRGYGRQSDGRTVLGFGGGYRVLDNDQLSATVSYGFSQSLHFKLNEYDLQGHLVRLDVATPPRPRFQLGLSAWYDFYALNYQSFSQEGIALPWVTLFEGQVSATQLYYRFRSRDYFRGPLDPFLDGYNNAVGLRQYLLLGAEDRVLDLGYQYDDEDPISRNGNDFQYQGHQFDARIQGDLPQVAHAVAGYLFHFMEGDFANSRSNSGFVRRDRQHQFFVRFERPVAARVVANLTYLGTVNSSNTDEFRYDRHIVSVGVGIRF